MEQSNQYGLIRHAVFETEILTDHLRGIYTVTTYYSDGTEETREVPKGTIFIPKDIYCGAV